MHLIYNLISDASRNVNDKNSVPFAFHFFHGNWSPWLEVADIHNGMQLCTIRVIYIYFSMWVFFYQHSQITRLQRKGEGISLTPHYHLLLLQRQLDINLAITVQSWPLYINSGLTRTGNFWFPSSSR